jgi:hypothetical protein
MWNWIRGKCERIPKRSLFHNSNFSLTSILGTGTMRNNSTQRFVKYWVQFGWLSTNRCSFIITAVSWFILSSASRVDPFVTIARASLTVVVGSYWWWRHWCIRIRGPHRASWNLGTSWWFVIRSNVCWGLGTSWSGTSEGWSWLTRRRTWTKYIVAASLENEENLYYFKSRNCKFRTWQVFWR